MSRLINKVSINKSTIYKLLGFKCNTKTKKIAQNIEKPIQENSKTKSGQPLTLEQVQMLRNQLLRLY